MRDTGLSNSASTLEAARVANLDKRGVRSQLVRKTREHIEGEKNLKGQERGNLKSARRRLAKQRRARRARQKMQFGKRMTRGCTRMGCENEVKHDKTRDRLTCKKDLDRFAQKKYQDDQMKYEATAWRFHAASRKQMALQWDDAIGEAKPSLVYHWKGGWERMTSPLRSSEHCRGELCKGPSRRLKDDIWVLDFGISLC